ncbi:MAG: prolyl oligopeptidase family serine peptidase [Gemmatimonadaceae bacterium]|nr:prolyl oligopeptidase family serine peptidase [Gemmatimonadaceae bacterium]
MSRSSVGRVSIALALLLSGAFALPLAAQNNSDWSAKDILARETFVKPPAVIERLVDAPRQTNVTLQNLSPDRKFFLDTRSAGLPTLKEFGKSHYYFAGLQVDHKANRARTLTTRGSAGIQVVDAATGKPRVIETPRGASVSGAEWSPDATKIAFIANFDDASRIYVADVATGKSKVLTQTPLLATLVTSLAWTSDGRIVAVLVPDNRGAEPVRPAVETGPLVRLTDPAKNPQRVFASLLRDPFEKDQMKYFITGQLAIVDSKTGAVKKVGAPAMISAVDPSPDGKYIRVTQMQEPFSYIVQYGSFGTVEQVWDADGRVVAELAKRPLRTSGADDPLATPGAGGPPVDTTRRNVAWLPNGQGLSFLRQERPARPAATDSADAPRGGAANRGKDRLYQWAPPFSTGSEKVLLESDNRMGGVLFNDDATMAFVAENVSGTGHVYAVDLNEPTKKHTLWRMRGINAQVGGGFGGFGGGRGGAGDDSVTFYQNPGNLVTKTGKAGRDVVQVSADGKFAFLRGTRYFRDWESQAPRGFVDKVEIRTGQKSRLFEGAADVFETVNASLDDDMTQMVITRESSTLVPNAILRSASGTLNLTSNTDPTPEFTKAIRKRIKVTRSDGINFMVNLTLPADYKSGTRLPAMLWLYPGEFTDQGGYDRTLRTENINRFPQGGPRTIEFLVLQGYAVANFAPPVIGASGRMNDNYVSDLQRNLSAVIDELDAQGFIDRTRLGIGGHSYGAFTTVNAMVHTPYFKAGIAGDGMYNRTLTPFNFQSERRDFYEAQATYLEMSPFFSADKLQGALLMYHSIEDQNVGTALLSSERMMHALEGLGKTASLYMYPYEDHGPAARETLLDQWARWTAWLDVYVKNANKPKVAS